MISDEMRELLSAYADGELRDADAARVEQLLSRDEALRAEVEDYARLGRRLRAWDDVEHGMPPAASLRARILARAREAQPRRASFLRGPRALAAALLLAAGTGLFAGIAASRAAPRAVVTAPESRVVLAPPAPQPAIPPLPPAPEEPVRAPAPTVRWGDDAGELVAQHAEGRYTQGQYLSNRARELLDEMATVERETERRRRTMEPPTRTVAGRDDTVAGMLATLRPHAGAYEQIVLLVRSDETGSADVMPLDPERTDILDQADDAQRVLVENERDEAGLLLAGEVLEAKDRGRRLARIVTGDSWVAQADFVPAVWAAGVQPSEDRTPLQPAGRVLGPRARKLIVAGGAPAAVPTADDWARERARLVETLGADARATGFAIVSDGAVVGVELFADHDLMLRFADRLLWGYFAEQGKALDLRAVRGRGDSVLRLAEEMLEKMPGRVARVVEDDRGTRDQWPEGVRRVRLLGYDGQLLGHGLLRGDDPIHLTLY